MSQIIGGHTFVALEKNIDDVKLNAITGGATITSELISTQTQTTSTLSGDYFLVLQAAGTLAKILTSDLATSLGSSSGMIGAITSVRLRSFSSIGNPGFELDQRTVGAGTNASGTFALDRWLMYKVGTMVGLAQRQAGTVAVPGTNFNITQNFLRVTVNTAEASLAAGDYYQLLQVIEGPNLRELVGDVHSISLLVRSSVAGLSFGLALRNSGTTYYITKLCTIPSANTWTLVTLPNIPLWPAAAGWLVGPSSLGYYLTLTLACGTTNTSPANDAWATGNFLGANGQSNLFATAGATWDVAFCQHEPGPLCTTLQDKPFSGANGNYEECLRYFTKSWAYGTAVGTANLSGANSTFVALNTSLATGFSPFPKSMAKAPTVTCYNANTGTINAALDRTAGPNIALTGINYVNDKAFESISSSAAFTAGHYHSVHYTADTGW